MFRQIQSAAVCSCRIAATTAAVLLDPLGRPTSSTNLTRLRNQATALRNCQEFQRSQLTELASTDFESWARESFEIATKIAYRNDGRIGIPRGGNLDCAMVAAAPVLPVGYVVNARRIADRRMILAGYRLADLLTWVRAGPLRSGPPSPRL